MLGPIRSMLDHKEILRLKLKGERKAAHEARPDAGIHAARNFLSHIPFSAAARIALYHPIGPELDTKPLAAELLERGHEIGLPVVVKKKAPLIFRRFQEGDHLIKGAFGVMTPQEHAPSFNPDIILVPLLGFDRRGGRLGYGGGFYDRTLQKWRGGPDHIAVGYAYGAQEVDAAPLTPLDQPLDWIVTEREAIKAG